MSDIAQEQQVYDDEVDYEEEEDFEIEDDLLDEEIDEDDGIDGEIAEAGVSFVHVRLSCQRAPGFSRVKGARVLSSFEFH